MRAGVPESRCLASGFAHLRRRASRAAMFPFAALRARSRPLVHGVEVLQAQLGRDRRDVARPGRRLFSTWMMLRVVEAARDLHDRVDTRGCGLRNWLPEAFPLARAADEAGDVDELDGGRDDLVGVYDAVEGGEPLVRDDDDADVRLDGAEGKVRRFCLRRAKRVEERGFADVRKTDDPDRKSHLDARATMDADAERGAPDGRSIPSRVGCASGAACSLESNVTCPAPREGRAVRWMIGGRQDDALVPSLACSRFCDARTDSLAKT